MASIPDDIFFATITELNQKLKAKEFSVVELTKAFSDRLDSLGPRYNALALSFRQQAHRAAKDIDGDLKRERVVARTEAFQAIGKSSGQLDHGKLFGLEFLVDFGDGGEEDVVRNGSHGML